MGSALQCAACNQGAVMKQQPEHPGCIKQTGPDIFESGMMLVSNLLRYTGYPVGHCLEGMGMLPMKQRSPRLDIGKTTQRIHPNMQRNPANREGTHPKGKFRNGLFSQWIQAVNLDNHREGRQLFEHGCAAVKIRYRLQGRIDLKCVGEGVHSELFLYRFLNIGFGVRTRTKDFTNFCESI